MMAISKYISSFGLGLITGTVTYHFLKKYIDLNDMEEETINEVLFFCNQGITCRDHLKKEEVKKSCSLVNCSFFNLSQILHYLNSAQRSLDVCIYLVTVKDLVGAVIRAHKRGVIVRVIADEDMINGSGSQMLEIMQQGIPVKHQHKSTTLMHHKFVVIDKRIVLSGSLNWTMQAICGNWDNLVITTQPQIVRSFIIEFDRLWKSFR